MKTLIILFAVALSSALTSYNASVESIESASQQLDATQIQMNNSTLKMYSGSRVKGTTVKEFLMYVDVLNTTDVMPTKIVSNKSLEEILADVYYSVELSDENGDGAFDSITITEN